MTYRRYAVTMLALTVLLVLLALACLVFGSVDIPVGRIVDILSGKGSGNKAWDIIILQSRIPMIATAALAGAALSISGLLLQTTFNNPLAGPSILGVSSGAGLGVAIVILALGGSLGGLLGENVGNSVATEEGVHNYVAWGFGNFSGVSAAQMPVYAGVIILALIGSALMVKPLNAMLLGTRYARNLGINVSRSRNILLLITGVLTAVVTAFCGPIGFIGLVVPHIARMSLGTSNHSRLVPATILAGADIALLCALASVCNPHGIIPINAITPIIGVPIILYIIINRRRIQYFN